MRKPYRVRAYLFYKPHILVVVGFGKGVALFGSVLMSADAAQRIGLAVQNEPVFRVERICAEAEPLYNAVNGFPARKELGF